ncbi:unnamed protein product [Protopolystoma xenopodis]|uniref:Uncharacterized protein n=1 Tax=Protopolystoma xenopodis TaxID=117903 RepID=A0A448X783_9PLAT|nr:unnamed protein product [Protopolystoma xenopodis]
MIHYLPGYLQAIEGSPAYELRLPILSHSDFPPVQSFLAHLPFQQRHLLNATIRGFSSGQVRTTTVGDAWARQMSQFGHLGSGCCLPLTTTTASSSVAVQPEPVQHSDIERPVRFQLPAPGPSAIPVQSVLGRARTPSEQGNLMSVNHQQTKKVQLQQDLHTQPPQQLPFKRPITQIRLRNALQLVTGTEGDDIVAVAADGAINHTDAGSGLPITRQDLPLTVVYSAAESSASSTTAPATHSAANTDIAIAVHTGSDADGNGGQAAIKCAETIKTSDGIVEIETVHPIPDNIQQSSHKPSSGLHLSDKEVKEKYLYGL